MSTDSVAPDSPAPKPVVRRARGPLVAAALLTLVIVALWLGRPWFEKYGWGRTLLNQTVGKVGLGSNPDFVLVSVAIDESLYDKKWKLVRWWPGRRSAKLHDDSVEALRRQIKDQWQEAERSRSEGQSTVESYHRGHAQRLEGDLQTLIEQEPSLICRIQYEVDVDGEPDLRDQIFVINNGTAWALPPEYQAKARAEFPE